MGYGIDEKFENAKLSQKFEICKTLVKNWRLCIKSF